MYFVRKGRNAWLNMPKKALFQGFWRGLDEIAIRNMFIPPIEIVLDIERQALLNNTSCYRMTQVPPIKIGVLTLVVKKENSDHL